MNIPVIVFYHCYLFGGTPPDLKPWAFNVVGGQMHRLEKSGLVDAASQIIIGLNGGMESLDVARLVTPKKAAIVLHGLESRCENPTVVLMEQWLKENKIEAHIFYFHAKGSSHDPDSEYGKFDGGWRECMMQHCVDNWRQCVADLKQFEACGCHWMENQASDRSQHYFAGTFFWARASFLRTLPSIMLRDRIKMSGLGHLDSRYEAEVWIGNGPRRPTIRDYHTGGIAH